MAEHLASITNVTNKSFDYIIVGGGTAGLCLASRLSEDPQVSVLVLESGGSHVKDPLVDMPTGFPQQMDNPKYDWSFKTTPQKNLDNGTVGWNRGKGLGGSSNINYMAWTRPSKEDIDSWERLGNPGWGFKDFVPYMKKCENLTTPTKEIATRGQLEIDPSWFGQQGNVDAGPISLAYTDMTSGAETFVRETLNARGIPLTADPVNGQTTGTWCAPANVNPVTLTRCSSYIGYYLPNAGRKNLHVLTDAHVNRLQLDKDANSGLVAAKGVEFTHAEKSHHALATREVILCAGALKSPQILELSGIGDSSVLEPLGIDVKLHLPGVGANVQDHISHLGLSFELREDTPVQTLDILSDPAELEKHFKLYSEKRRGLLSLTVSGLTFASVQQLTKTSHALVDAQLKKMSAEKHGYAPGLLEQYNIQAERLKDPQLHDCEIITNPIFSGYINKSETGKRYLSFILGVTSPWSRGTVHIASKDPAAQPLMDPHYLEEEIDLELLVEAFKFSRSMEEHEPFKSHVVKEVNPGKGVKSDEEIKSHIKQNFNTLWHTSSTLSMLPREKGGVVDPSLKIYGTSNIRVCDISIIPLLVGVHTQVIAYGIAEKAADIIRRGRM